MKISRRARLAVCCVVFVAVSTLAAVTDVGLQIANTFQQLQTFVEGIAIGPVTIMPPATVSSYTVLLPSEAPSPGYDLCNTSTAATWTWCSPAGVFSPGGDLAGSSTSETVKGINGFPIYIAPNQNGQVLKFNATIDYWIPVGIYDHYVLLQWIASVDPAAGYDVWRSTVSGGPYTQINTTPTPGTDSRLFYVDNTVVNGNTYYYVVTAFDGYDGPISSQVTAVVP
jgi:hypothetical protein